MFMKSGQIEDGERLFKQMKQPTLYNEAFEDNVCLAQHIRRRHLSIYYHSLLCALHHERGLSSALIGDLIS